MSSYASEVEFGEFGEMEGEGEYGEFGEYEGEYGERERGRPAQRGPGDRARLRAAGDQQRGGA